MKEIIRKSQIFATEIFSKRVFFSLLLRVTYLPVNVLALF